MESPSDRLRDSEKQEYSRAATFNLAQMLAFQDRFKEAAEAYEAFLRDDPENIDALTNAAVVLTRAAQQLSAEAEGLEEGAQKTALLEEADALREKAKEHYAKLTARDDLTADEYHNVGLGLNTIGMSEAAASAFTKALDVQPYRPGSLAQLAFAMFSLQNYDSLRIVATKLVERYPLSKNNLALLANAYRELEQPQKALEVLEKHEVLPVEIEDLSIAQEEGTYTLTGYIHNISMEPGAELEVQFDFYGDDGDVVVSETARITLPAQETEAEFTVTTESAAAISGVAYRRTDMAQQPTGSR
jgi:tetratricopeptide (TPR) repeat protein